MITSDDSRCYTREVPKYKHLVGEITAQRIQQNSMMLQTRTIDCS
ncbi:IS1 family transposase [Enterobacter vonholyi]|nr:hypothetical protein EEI76_13690 [Enterobacter cloacae]UAN18383.1 hypothetical protein KGP20_02010 [Enterobacter asburiae]UAN24586.1 hypothetical protein KGP25_20265 [Enterobacter sp. JBIWA003]UAN34035.1 hypothetical protein KGP22_18560 [Enterobacter sp. JBIWA005]